jgi:hypothetical protein
MGRACVVNSTTGAALRGRGGPARGVRVVHGLEPRRRAALHGFTQPSARPREPQSRRQPLIRCIRRIRAGLGTGARKLPAITIKIVPFQTPGEVESDLKNSPESLAFASLQFTARERAEAGGI